MTVTAAAPAMGQKPGGVLRVYHRDSPASMSIHEEGTIGVIMPMMGVFNNLVLFDQHVPQNSMTSIVPELATSWSWNDDATELTFKLRDDVKWHDGQPFTAADVKCTFDLLTGQAKEKLRLNYRESWWVNVASTTINGDHEATLHLKRPQPAILALLASGDTPIYPCHVSAHDMRQHPIGTGPFKFVDYKPNQWIKVARNPDYWKPGRPYLDGIEYTIIPNRSTAILAFIAGNFDMTFPYEVTIPLLKDIRNQAPQAVCQTGSAGESVGLLVNRTVPPFDNAELRRAMALTLDRRSFIDILGQGEGDLGGAMLPPPEGVWGMPPEMLATLPGYAGDMQKNRDEARAIMAKLGYGADKRLPIKVSTRNIAVYRDPAAILIDQLKEIGIDGELDTVETANWVPKLIRKDFKVGLNVLGTAVDDPDVYFYQNYVCSSARNYPGYCNPALDKMVDQQSMETDPEKRKAAAQQVDYTLQKEMARPIIYHLRAATCWQPNVKGLTLMVNSQYNGWRMEDVWLDRP
ncbi:MAG: ABC transporter substrate-binding protein [Alphaproteobacteria bacterium]|nr:ABC transporter substrate-binding protein [Alphaproteobacteria bacterium]MBV9863148.1 ABC transporter substrate-binding protein [Alphaproteobacteria bacterium]